MVITQKKQVYGIDEQRDLQAALISREARPLRVRFREGVWQNARIVIVLTALYIGICPWFYVLPNLVEVLSVFLIGFTLYARGLRPKPFFRVPLKDTKKGDEEDAGIIYFGSDPNDGREAWFSDSDLRTHCVVFGTTGSGKTMFLLSMFYQALLIGSGAIYVDGKADNTVWWMAYALARRLGREDDILVINYLTGGLQKGLQTGDDGRAILGRRTNTTNPLADVAPEQARSLIVGLMRESSGEGEMWKGRASAMLGGLLKALCEMRDKELIVLGINEVRSRMTLDSLVDLAWDENLSMDARITIRKYIAELPGLKIKTNSAYQRQDIHGKPVPLTEAESFASQNKPEVNPEDEGGSQALQQHGFLMMQLTEVMADMTDTYAHIFGVPLGEVDFRDVVFNRRILFVMLPALEADPDRLGNLGKMIIAGIRSALAPALGSEVEGSRTRAVEQKPTNAKVPFMLILDEYGYYAVEGFAVVAAQARSLGVSVIFAGQDYPSFKRSSETEASATLANTNVTIAMKLEDAEETFKIIQGRGGQATEARAQTYSRRGARSAVVSDPQAQIERRERIDLRDLVTQAAGEAHLMWGDVIARIKVVYVDPGKLSAQQEAITINQFVMVKPPSRAMQEFYKSEARKEEMEKTGLIRLIESARQGAVASGGPPGERAPNPADTLFEDYARARARGLDFEQSARYAAGIGAARIQADRQKEDRDAKQYNVGSYGDIDDDVSAPPPGYHGSEAAPSVPSVEEDYNQSNRVVDIIATHARSGFGGPVVTAREQIADAGDPDDDSAIDRALDNLVGAFGYPPTSHSHPHTPGVDEVKTTIKGMMAPPQTDAG